MAEFQQRDFSGEMQPQTSLMSVRKYNNLFGYHHEYSNRPYTSGQEWYEQVLKLRTWYVMVYFVPVMYLYSYIP